MRAATTIVWAVLAASCRAPHVWTGPPSPAKLPLQNYDVYWDTNDGNGLPLNPMWGPNHQSPPVLPPDGPKAAGCYNDPSSCTSEPTATDWAPGVSICRFGVAFNLAGPFAAHVDWMVATYTGLATLPVGPNGNVVPISDDDDFNAVFVATEANDALSNRGLTSYNESVSFSPPIGGESSHRYIELEFDSRELRPHFQEGGWWQQFGDLSSDAVGPQRPGESDADAAARRDAATTGLRQLWHLGDNRPFSRATITGIFGVDCEHGCKSEIHPVYLMALETETDPSQNTWTIFARNWGNEGSCGTWDHQFAAKTLTVAIPAPAGANSQLASITDINYARPSDASTPSPVISSSSSNDALLVTFSMPPSTEQTVQELFVVINWGTAQPGRSATPPARVASRKEARPAPTRVSDATTVDEYVAALASSIPDYEAQIAALMSATRTPSRNVSDDVVSYDIQPYRSRTLDFYQGGGRLSGHGQPRGVATWIVLCRANKGSLPLFMGKDMNEACKKVNWRQP
jgi:hypothetical protein